MNFLQIVQRLHQECGCSGPTPTTVVAQTGETKRLVDWAATAWQEIATARDDWNWLRKSFSFATVTSQQDYDPALAPLSLTDFASFAPNTFRYYITSVGTNSEQRLQWWPDFEEFENYYQFGSMRTMLGVPLGVTESPGKHLLIGPLPDATGYTIVGKYFSVPTELALDADTPALGTRYHMVIVYLAMMMYAGYDAASEVYQRGELWHKRLMTRIFNDQLPQVTLGGPLR